MMKVEFTEKIDDFGRVEITGRLQVSAGTRLSSAEIGSARVDLKGVVRDLIQRDIDKQIYGDASAALAALRRELSRWPMLSYTDICAVDSVGALLDTLSKCLHSEGTEAEETKVVEAGKSGE